MIYIYVCVYAYFQYYLLLVQKTYSDSFANISCILIIKGTAVSCSVGTKVSNMDFTTLSSVVRMLDDDIFL